MTQKYSKAVIAQWGGKVFGVGGVLSKEFQIRDGSIALRTEHGKSVVPHLPISVIELRRSFEPKRMEGVEHRWAIIHWVGEARDPAKHPVEGLFIEDIEASETDAMKIYAERVNQWRKTGSIMFPEDAPTLKGNPLPKKPSKPQTIGERFEEQRLTAARTKVLKQSFPATVAAMESKGNSGLAFEFESGSNREPMDAVDLALATHWKEWQGLTAKELSDAVYAETRQRLKPRTLEKRRERIDLTTKRPTGPRPKTEQS